jgi:hypothetical protein
LSPYQSEEILMRPLTIFMLLACLAFYSCKLDNLNPDNAKPSSTNTLTLSPPNPTGHAPVAGVWKWSAQYDLGTYEGDLLNPTNTGIIETLTLAADSTWSQTQNGKVVNSGTYHLGAGYMPSGGLTPFLKLVNNNQPNLQTFDNFDFSTGFVCSFASSSDSLVFYGVFNTPQYTNLATQRVYVK